MTSPYPWRWQDIAMLILGPVAALTGIWVAVCVTWLVVMCCTPLVLLMEMM